MLSISTITTILDAGSQYDLPEYLKNRVRPTNILCLLLIFALGIPFSIISLIYFPKMALFPSVASLACLLIMVVNAMGGIYYSRVVLPTLLLMLSSLYNAYLSTSMDDAITSVSLVELSFTLIPFIVFDFREKGFLIFCNLFSFFIILIFPLSWEHFDMGYDGLVLRQGPLAVLTTCLAMIAQTGSIYGLAILNRQAETRSAQLLSEMNEKSIEAEQSRKELEVNLEKLETARTEEAHRQWTSEGIAKLTDLLRTHGAGSQTYDAIISMIVKNIGANQAGLYVVDNADLDQVLLRLAACYAYDRKKYIEKTFAPGQGMVGQTYLEGEYIYLTEIPQNYISITSGLGEACPTVLLIMPLKINDTIEGILEIASFKKLAPYQISFLEKLAENIAGFIQSNRINQQTKKMLEISLQQAEEMRAQEEEMRQNMEELEATQEEMRRNTTITNQLKKELDARITILDQVALLTESDLSGNITYANEKFCQVSKWPMEEVLGKPHNIVRHPDNPKSLYTEMWDKIKKGETFRGIFKNKAKDNSTYWVDATIAPILNESGCPIKYISIRYDITEQVLKGEEMNELFNSSQQQRQELQAQEEALRQNLEEISATQEEFGFPPK